MATILIIASILIASFIIRAIIKRYTDRGSMNKSVSWEYVKSNLLWTHKQCPKCDLESNKLNWFEFRTSDASWRHLAGRKGFYSMCPDCKIVVEDITTVMN